MDWPQVTIRRSAWLEIQEAIDWLIEQKYWYERTTLHPMPGHPDDGGIAVRFTFDKPSDALMFKLAWGGE